MTVEIAEPQAKSLIDLLSELPAIAGFWRRFFAWMVDTLLLGIAGQVLGWALSSFWYQVGPYGRIFGLVVIVGYFGILNSRIGGGQTLGKRWLGIAVRDKENKPIGVGRSLVRILVLAAPLILNGWGLPIFQGAIMQWVVSVIIFGVGGGIAYTMVANRKTRQGLHDLICGTYVVRSGTVVTQFPETARIHRMVSVGIIVLAMVLATASQVYSPAFISRMGLTQVNDLHQTLQTDSRFFSVGVNDSTVNFDGTSTHSLNIQVWNKGKPTENERNKIMDEIAKIVLENTEDPDQFDFLQIGVISAYDLGIASGNETFSQRGTFDAWRERIASPGSS